MTTTIKPKKKRFRDIRSVKQEIGNLYNQAKSGDMDLQKATKLTNILKVLLDACDKIISSENIEELRALVHKKKYGDRLQDE